jgi:hypothetical protein
VDAANITPDIVGAVLVAIALIKWDNRQMQRQAERKARSVRTKPFPDFDEWKQWDNSA